MKNLIVRIKSQIKKYLTKSIVVDGRKLVAPYNHLLDIHFARYPLYNKRIAEIINEQQKPIVIDVGANIGDTVLSKGRYYCFEGDKTFLKFLKKNTTGLDVKIFEIFLSDTDSVIRGSVQTTGDTSKITSGREDIDVRTLDSVIRENPEVGEATVLKIDTDGFDEKVLKGAVNFLKEKHPIIFFEYAPQHSSFLKKEGVKFLGWLESLGYNSFKFYDNFGEFLAESKDFRKWHDKCGTDYPFYDIEVRNV